MGKVLFIFFFFICHSLYAQNTLDSVDIKIDMVKKKVIVDNKLNKPFKLKLISEERHWDRSERFSEADFFEVKKGKYKYDLNFKNITKASEQQQIRDIKKTDVLVDSIIVYTLIKPSYRFKGSRASNVSYRVLSNIDSGIWFISFNSYKKSEEFYNIIGLPTDEDGNYINDMNFSSILEQDVLQRTIGRFPIKIKNIEPK